MQKAKTDKILSAAEIEQQRESKNFGMTEEQLAILSKGVEDKKALERLTTIAKRTKAKTQNDLLKKK